MRKLLLILSLVLFSLTLSACTRTETVSVSPTTATTTTTVIVTAPQTTRVVTVTVGQLVEAQIELIPRHGVSEGSLSITRPLAYVGILEKDYYSLIQSRWISAGERGIIVTGVIRNEESTAWQFSFIATGYDASGRVVSRIMDRGSTIYSAVEIIPAKSDFAFTFHLSFAEDVKLIEITADAYSTAQPLP